MNPHVDRVLQTARPIALKYYGIIKEEFTVQPGELRVIARPAVWSDWLKEARVFLYGALALAFFTKFLFALVATPVFKFIYPVKVSNSAWGNLFGNGGGKVLRWQVALNDWTQILFVMCACVALAGLWRAIRPISRLAAQKVRELEAAANSASVAGNLAPALLGLEEAKRWAANGAHRKLLDDKASIVRARLAGQSSFGTPQASAPATGMPAGGTQMITPAGGTLISNAGPATVGPGGRYELRRMLGKGGMGEVHEAFDTSLDRIVAMKKLPTHLVGDAQFLLRFTQEAKALAKVSHPFIVQIYDIVRDADGCHIALEYVSGGDLQSKIDREGKISAQATATLGRKMAEGLAFAHGQGIVHRDIKPLNILLTSDEQPKLTDFGLAKVESNIQLTMEGAIMGSPAYMSPEQASGRVADARSDVYSFGVMLYHMLTGRTPYEGDTGQVLAMHLTQRVPNIAGAPAELDAIIQKCTEPKPENRFPSGSELAKAFQPAGERL